jgi:hypothetical protein
LADSRQKRKHFLSVNRTFLTVDRQNLSFRIEGFQRVEPFPFLITKKPSLKPSPERAPTAQSQATAFIKTFQRPRPTPEGLATVCILQSKFRKLAKSQIESPYERKKGHSRKGTWVATTKLPHVAKTPHGNASRLIDSADTIAVRFPT